MNAGQAWSAWYTPEHDMARYMATSRHEAMCAAFIAGYESARAAERERWTREAIIARLAAKYGPHKAYVSATRSYEPDGNNAEGSCMVSQIVMTEETWHICGDDGPCDCKPVQRAGTQLSPLTYGEVADALTDLLEAP